MTSIIPQTGFFRQVPKNSVSFRSYQTKMPLVSASKRVKSVRCINRMDIKTNSNSL